MPENFYWKINHNYRDCGVKDSALGYPDEDEFASKVSIDRAAHWGIANAGGIRTLRSSSQPKTQSDESKNTIDTIEENKTIYSENSEKDEQLRDKIIDLFDGEILT